MPKISICAKVKTKTTEEVFLEQIGEMKQQITQLQAKMDQVQQDTTQLKSVAQKEEMATK